MTSPTRPGAIAPVTRPTLPTTSSVIVLRSADAARCYRASNAELRRAARKSPVPCGTGRSAAEQPVREQREHERGRARGDDAVPAPALQRKPRDRRAEHRAQIVERLVQRD